MAGSECFHGLVDRLDERQHGLFQLALELRFMGLKPLPAVISFEAAQEFEAGFSKVWFAGGVRKRGNRHDENKYRSMGGDAGEGFKIAGSGSVSALPVQIVTCGIYSKSVFKVQK